MQNKILAAALTSIMLVGCGGGGGGSDTPASNASVNEPQPTHINSFNISGNELAGEDLSINSGIDNGSFSVNWDVDSSDPYHIELFVSSDSVLSASDTSFFHQNCGSLPTFNCGNTGNFECTFSNENKISCGEVTPINQEKDLTSMLGALPADIHIILKACNGLFDDCRATSIEVTLN